MIRVVTITREYGSGGGTVAKRLAADLGWKLVDNPLIDEIAEAGQVRPELAERYDECVDPWFHRVTKALWHGGYEGVVTAVEEEFDADAMATLWRRVIEQAAEIGNCVIVGRGAQCILQERADTLHVSLHAPMRDKIGRLKERGIKGADLAAVALETDRRRDMYIRRYFKQDSRNPHLYDLMICTSLGEDRVVAAIRSAAGLS